MHKDFLAYAFYKCAKKEYNADGTVFVNERDANFQPLAEWDSLLAIVAFDPSYTVSAYSNKPCGHVGVRDKTGKCLQCTINRDAARAERERERNEARAERVKEDASERERVEGIRGEIAQLEQRTCDATLEIQELQREIDGNVIRVRSLYRELVGRSMVGTAPVAGISRAHARSIGALWYHPDTPCKYCGGYGLRYVANGRCRDCGSGTKR